MDESVKRFMAWYGWTFRNLIEDRLVVSGFEPKRAKFWGFNVFRRPARAVLTSVGMKAKKDTEDFLGMIVFATLLAACVTVGVCGMSPVSFASAVMAFLVAWISLVLMRSSFRDEIALCEIGMKVYAGLEWKFLCRYSTPLVLLAVSEAGKSAAKFTGTPECDEFMAFCGKLQSFGGFEDE